MFRGITTFNCSVSIFVAKYCVGLNAQLKQSFHDSDENLHGGL